MFTSSGIDSLGRVAWGTHLCHFYDDPETMAEAVVPYLRAGLDNQEQCLWITAAPFGVEDARAILRNAVPDLEARERRCEVEIVHRDAWYQRTGALGADAVIREWMGREQAALAAGRRGLRLSGNMTALNERPIGNLVEFEAAIHDMFHGRRMMALCSYCAAGHSAAQTFDILRHHKFALTRARDGWEIWEGNSVAARPHGGAVRSRALLRVLPAAIYTTDADGRLTFYNEAAAELWGVHPTLGEAQWCGSWKLFRPDGTPMRHEDCPLAVAIKENRAVRGIEAIAERPDGSRITFIAYPTPLHDGAGRLIGAVNMLVDITERKLMEERVELYAREIGHRAQNLLASITAILRLSKAPDIRSFVETVAGRVSAFARVHQLIGGDMRGSAGLATVAAQTLAAYRGESGERIALVGSDVALSLDESQGLAIVLHELATNSVKYGALSDGDGRVAVEWSLDGGNRLRLAWRELGGPIVVPPANRGFGTRLIEATAHDKLKGTAVFDWRPGGLVCEISGELAAPLN